MKEKYDYHDRLRWEMFEKLLPKMIYDGSDEERNNFFDSLRENAQGLVYFLYQSVCKNDGEKCRYKAEDFVAETVSRGNIGMVKIQLPEHNPDISDILRVYAAFSERADKLDTRLYFIVKRFWEGQIFIMYVNSQLETLKIEEITDHTGNEEYEYWRVAASYARIICDMMAEKELTERHWSRDWDAFDWEPVMEKLKNGGQDIGITKEEFLEFIDWFCLCDPEGYGKTILLVFLESMGATDKTIEHLSEHTDEFMELIMKYKKEKGMLSDFIFFHNPDEENGYLSNWHLSNFTESGNKFSSMEQYMMHSKAVLFGDAETAEKILLTNDVAEIKGLGRQVRNFDDAVWDKQKCQIIRQGLLQKFTQNKELAEQLVNTGSAVIAECAVKDTVWGIGLSMTDKRRYDVSAWRGQNLLGKCLMQVRSIIGRQYEKEKAAQGYCEERSVNGKTVF